MTLSLTALCLGLAALAQLPDSRVDFARPPTVLHAAPPDDEYVEITRAGVPVAPAVYYSPVNPPRGYYPAQQVSTVTTRRPPVVAQHASFAPADMAPTLNGPSPPPANAVPVAPHQAMPSHHSLFTNGYGGTRAYSVSAPACTPTVPYQPISSLGPAPVLAQPTLAVAPNYYVGRGVIGQPKLYVRQQPVRNFLRWLTP